MDDLMYRYNNQNSIYVLNSSINSYGQDFGRLNLLACPQLNPAALTNDDRSVNCPESQLTALSNSSNCSHNYNNNTSCSSVTRSLQYKLKTLGSLSGPDAIGNPVGIASSMSLSSQSSNGVVTTCSPAAAALQKLFNCTSVTGTINGSNNTCNSNSSCNLSGSSNNNSNINMNVRDCRLSSVTEADVMRDSGAMLSNGSNNMNCNSSTNKGCSNSSTYSNSTTNITSNNNSNNGKKKTTTNVKSTLIAKKTKFLKFLEEEKWRANDDSIENLSTTNCERNRGDGNNMYSNTTALRGNSTAFNAISTSSAAPTTGGSFPHNNYNMNGNSHHFVAETSTSQQQQQQQPHQQYKSNNWSGNHDSNNQKQQQKTSSELYKEAAELLGLSCTLCDNCRCLDCQSGYFDCDDSDSYSELSFMDEYDEEVAATAAATTTSVFMMHADYEYNEDDTAQQHKTYTQQHEQQQNQLGQHEYQHQQQHLQNENAGQRQQHQEHKDYLPCNGIDCNSDNDYSVENTGNYVEETTNAGVVTTAAAVKMKTNEGIVKNLLPTTNDAATTINSTASNATAKMTDVAINEELAGVNLTPADNEMSKVVTNDAARLLMMASSNNNICSTNAQAQSTTTTTAAETAVVTSTAKTHSQLNELEPCASFNELSLMDAQRRVGTRECSWAVEEQANVACDGSK